MALESLRSGMMIGMTVEKITVSIPHETLKKARGAIRRGRATSLSAYISRALEREEKDNDLLALLDEMLDQTGGPLTPAEERAADRVLGIKPRRNRKKAK